MKRITAFFFFPILIFLLINSSCSKSSNGSKECDLSYSEPTSLTSATPVIYVAGFTGSASGSSISSLSYQDSAGVTAVSNPVLPWAKLVNLQTGATPSISAKGTAAKGDTLNIAIAINGSATARQCAN
jgi:hypothetical protein